MLSRFHEEEEEVEAFKEVGVSGSEEREKGRELEEGGEGGELAELRDVLRDGREDGERAERGVRASASSEEWEEERERGVEPGDGEGGEVEGGVLSSFKVVVVSSASSGSEEKVVAVGVVGDSGCSEGEEGVGAEVAKGGGDAMAAAPFLPCFLFRSFPLNLPSSTSSSTGAGSSFAVASTSETTRAGSGSESPLTASSKSASSSSRAERVGDAGVALVGEGTASLERLAREGAWGEEGEGESSWPRSRSIESNKIL